MDESTPSGQLYRGQVGSNELVACIDGKEGLYYVIPDGGAAAEEGFNTWRMARPPAGLTQTDTQPSAPLTGVQTNDLTGLWQTAPEGSSVAFGLVDTSIENGEHYYDWMALSKNHSAENWHGILHKRLSPDSQAQPWQWDQRPIELRWSAPNCQNFERQRLALPWQVTAAPPEKPATPSLYVQTQILTHPATALYSIRLLPGRYLKQTQATRINSNIESLANEMNRDWSSCEYYDGDISLIAASSRVVVFDLRNATYCGGAHPNEDQIIRSFDLRSGQPFDVTHWFSSPPRDAIPARLLKKLYLHIDPSQDDEQGCIERMQETKNFSAWLSPTGVQFRYYETARSAIECEGDYVLPFKTVRPFISSSRRGYFDSLVKSFQVSPR